jgi:hypothetical protein
MAVVFVIDLQFLFFGMVVPQKELIFPAIQFLSRRGEGYLLGKFKHFFEGD